MSEPVRSGTPGAGAGREGVEQVQAYLDALPTAQRRAVDAIRKTVRTVLPYADECLRYGLPAVALHGKGVAGYGAFADHWSYFPMSGAVLAQAGDVVARYPASKGGIRLGLDQRLPVTVVRTLVRLRLAEISAVTTGRRSEYYPDGRLKAVGGMKDGELDGRWKWYRNDGTLLRTGEFALGAQTGVWTTWERDGTAGKVTRFRASSPEA